MIQVKMPLAAAEDEPAFVSTTRSRVPAHVRVTFLADDDSLAFADTHNPMPTWRAVKLVERLRRSDHDLFDVTWYRADNPPPDPDGCRWTR